VSAFVPDTSRQMSEIGFFGRPMKRPLGGRVRRTRLKLIRAFNKLVLERGYAKVTVADVISEAGVVRSTFYEHFQTKDDILRQSIKPFFSALADSVVEPEPSDQLVEIIGHFWENRRLAHAMFSGAMRPLVSGFLSDLIEERLVLVVRRSRAVKPLVPVRLMAAQLAESQLGLIDAWVSGKAASSPEAVSQLLHRTTNASASMWSGRI